MLRGGDLDPPKTIVAVGRERDERESRRSVRRARSYSHSQHSNMRSHGRESGKRMQRCTTDCRNKAIALKVMNQSVKAVTGTRC